MSKQLRCEIISSCFACDHSHYMVNENTWFCQHGLFKGISSTDFVIPTEIIEDKVIDLRCKLPIYYDVDDVI